MHMAMKDCLPRTLARVDSNIESANGRVLCLNAFFLIRQKPINRIQLRPIEIEICRHMSLGNNKQMALREGLVTQV